MKLGAQMLRQRESQCARGGDAPAIAGDAITFARRFLGLRLAPTHLRWRHLAHSTRAQLPVAMITRIMWREEVGPEIGLQEGLNHFLSPGPEIDLPCMSMMLGFVRFRPVHPDAASRVEIARPHSAGFAWPHRREH